MFSFFVASLFLFLFLCKQRFVIFDGALSLFTNMMVEMLQIWLLCFIRLQPLSSFTDMKCVAPALIAAVIDLPEPQCLHCTPAHFEDYYFEQTNFLCASSYSF